jgi:hypothetical protein
MMSAGLEADINRGTFNRKISTGSILQSHDFGMRPPRALGMTLTHHMALRIHNHAPHTGIGRSDAKGLLSKVQGFLHERAGGHERKES